MMTVTDLIALKHLAIHVKRWEPDKVEYTTGPSISHMEPVFPPQFICNGVTRVSVQMTPQEVRPWNPFYRIADAMDLLDAPQFAGRWVIQSKPADGNTVCYQVTIQIGETFHIYISPDKCRAITTACYHASRASFSAVSRSIGGADNPPADNPKEQL